MSSTPRSITSSQESHISDAERAFLAKAAYRTSPGTPVDGNTGEWSVIGEPGESGGHNTICCWHFFLRSRLDFWVIKK